MHKFNTLKYGGGGAVTLLSQHVAQRMVRHVSKRNGGTASGGSEKKYKITNNRSGDGIVYPEYAAPGEYVRQKGSAFSQWLQEAAAFRFLPH